MRIPFFFDMMLHP